MVNPFLTQATFRQHGDKAGLSVEEILTAEEYECIHDDEGVQTWQPAAIRHPLQSTQYNGTQFFAPVVTVQQTKDQQIALRFSLYKRGVQTLIAAPIMLIILVWVLIQEGLVSWIELLAMPLVLCIIYSFCFLRYKKRRDDILYLLEKNGWEREEK